MYTHKSMIAVLTTGLLMGLAGAAVSQTSVSRDAEGLSAVKSQHLDQVLLRPGTEFRGYKKLILEPAQVAFRSDWLKEMNKFRIAVLQRTTQQDADRLAADVGEGLNAQLALTFRRAGYALATTPAADVLRVSPRIVDLYVNAPRSVTTALPGRTYTLSAGEATFVLDIRDSDSGRLLAHVVDRRTVGDRGDFRSSLRSTTPPSNAFDFEGTFQYWAQGSAGTLAEAKDTHLP